MRRLKWMAGLAAVMVSASGIAENKLPGDLSNLKGTWTADCTAFAPGARCSLQWADGLHKNLLRVVYQVRKADGALTTYWGRTETEEGKTRYALNAEGGLSVTDWVKKNGNWHQFMHADYQLTTAICC